MRRNVERALLVLLGIGLSQLLPHATVIQLAGQLAAKRLAVATSAREQKSSSTGVDFRSTQRPNVIITLLDDAGAGDAGALGHPLLRTPNIDSFARAAVAFSQAYAGAPNCSPSRASLLTGRAAFRTGVYDFLSKSSGDMHLARRERTIANVLRGHGYATTHFGKWHLRRGLHGHSPYNFGFDHSNGSFLAASALLRSFGGWMRHGRRTDQPFFAYLALWEPHEPVHYWAPRRLRRLYTQPAAGAHAELRFADNRGSILRSDRSMSLEDFAPAVASGGGSCVWRLPKRNPPSIYYGAMSQVDESFGWMLAELDRRDLRKNTIVFLTSDNGPEHRELNSWGSSGGLRGAKGYVYEGGIRIPLLVQWPAQLKVPLIVHEPVHLWDLLPTICAAIGIDLSPARVIDGVNVLSLMRVPVEQHVNAPVTTGPFHDEHPASEVRDNGGSDLQDFLQNTKDLAGVAAAAEMRGQYVRTRPYVEQPIQPPLRVSPPQSLPLPRPSGAGLLEAHVERHTPLFWAMHRGRGGMQYALRSGPWKLVGGYGHSAARGDGPREGEEVVPWLREHATIGRVELYLITHDPAERVDLAVAYPHVVSVLLLQMKQLLRDTAREGPDVIGWTQRAPPCPRLIKKLNVTEQCCHPRAALWDDEIPS